MNRRMLLNLMIFGLITFYLVFSLVHRNFIEKQGGQVDEVLVTKWQQRRLVPLPWTITRIEYGDKLLKRSSEGWQFMQAGQLIAHDDLAGLIENWQQLTPERIDFYQQTPEQGITALVFIAEDSQPLIFRVVSDEQGLAFYRMLDERKFTFDHDAKFLP
jgi:hypothetical protein